MALLTKELVLREIPHKNGKVRKDFVDLKRVISSQSVSPEDLAFLYEEVRVRKTALGIKEKPPAKSRRWSHE